MKIDFSEQLGYEIDLLLLDTFLSNGNDVLLRNYLLMFFFTEPTFFLL